MNFIQNIIDSFKLLQEKEDHNVVIEGIEKGVVFKGTNLWILIFAIFIASLGLNVNSTAVIIGAMLISPLMGPIMGLGLSLGINNLTLFRKSAYNYVFATIVGLITSTIFFLVSPINEAHSEILARTQPNIYDVLIAFFGGLAGVFANSSKQKGNVIPGVAIATALMPPLCTAGFGLATGKFSFFFGAFYLYLINTVFIALATLLTVKYLHFPVNHFVEPQKEKRNKRWITSIIILTILPSIYFGYQFIQDTKFQNQANQFIEKHSKIKNEYLLNKKIDAHNKKITLVYGGVKMSEEQLESLQEKFKLFNFHRNASLEIKQGFSYLDNNALSENTSFNKQDVIIQQLQNQLDSINHYENLTPSMFSEIKAIYPEVSNIAVQEALLVDTLKGKHIVFGLIKTSKEITAENKLKIEKWFIERIKIDSIQTIFYKDEKK